MPNPQIKLPPGATLVSNGSSGMALPPGATLVSGGDPSQGPDDPNGNYDFDALGSVQGLRTNGRPATRQEALQFLTGSPAAGLAQAMGDRLQQGRQDVHNYVNWATDTNDQMQKENLVDMAGMLLTGGDPAAGQAARWAQGETAGSAARLAAKFAVNRIPGVGLARDISDAVSEVAPDAVPDLTNVIPFLKGLQKKAPAFAADAPANPTFFNQFGEQQHLPVTPAKKSYQVFPPDDPTAAMSAADTREAGTAARPAVTATRTPAAPTPGSTPPASSPDPAGPPVTGLAGTNEGAPADAPPVTTPQNLTAGGNKQRSNLAANKRQLASPTGSTAPNAGGQNQTIMPVPGFSLADFKNFANVLDALTKK